MTSVPPSLEPAEETRELRRRLSWLMGGRLVVATLLLGGTMLLALEQERGVSAFTPRFLLALILSTYCASLAFALWLPRARRLNRFAITQIGWDLGLTTGLVYVAGGAASGFTFLYGTTVLMAAIVVGPRAAQVATVASLLLYLAVGLSLTNGWLAFPSDQPSDRYLLKPTDATFTMLVNILGLMLVAFLATNLAGRLRLTGGRLREAAAHAAELARLNEDIIRSLSSGLLTTDAEHIIRTVNPAGLEIFRTRRDVMVGKPLSEFFLDEVAQRFLSEGRQQYDDRALSTEFVLNQGRELMLLTWLGDSANEAIAALLIRRGFVASPAGPGVEVRLDGRSAEDVLDALSDAAVDEPPSLDMLLQDVSNLQREKWDWALPDGLLRKAYASLNLDLDEGLAWARTATADAT